MDEIEENKEGIHMRRGNKELQFLMDIYRALSMALVKPLAKTSITPNQITIFSLVTGILAGVFLAMEQTLLVVILAFLSIQLSFFSDYVDGDLARRKRQMSILGAWAECIVDPIVETAIFFGMTWGVYVVTQSNFVLLLGLVIIVMRLFETILFLSIYSAIPKPFKANFLDHKQNFVLRSVVLRQFILTRTLVFFVLSILVVVVYFYNITILGYSLMFWFLVVLAVYNVVFYLGSLLFIFLKVLKLPARVDED